MAHSIFFKIRSYLLNLDAYEELVLKTLEDCLRLSYTVDLVLRDVSTKGSCFSPPPDTKKPFGVIFVFVLDFLMLAMTLARTCSELVQLLTTNLEMTYIEHAAANGNERGTHGFSPHPGSHTENEHYNRLKVYQTTRDSGRAHQAYHRQHQAHDRSRILRCGKPHCLSHKIAVLE